MNNTFAPDYPLSKQQYVNYLNSLIPKKYDYDISEDSSKDLMSPTLLYADPNGNVFSVDVTIEQNANDTWNHVLQNMHKNDAERMEEGRLVDYYYIPEEPTINKENDDATGYLFDDEWQEIDRIATGMFINPSEQIIDILKNVNPYTADIAKNTKNPGILLLEPELEQLFKAGYAIADTALNSVLSYRDVEIFKKYIKPGTDIAHILRLPAYAYRRIKNISEFGLWDGYADICLFTPATKEDIEKMVNLNFGEYELQTITDIIGKAGSVDKIIHYLNRAMTDHPENFKTRISCMQMLHDSIDMADGSDLTFNFKRYDLKRQHDQLVKLRQIKEDKQIEEDLTLSVIGWQKFTRRTNKFVIRPVESLDELNDEAEQMNNCVASYAEEIAERRKAIFLLRKIDNPDKSYVTVEISTQTGVLLQAFLANNAEITDTDTIHFLQDWESDVYKVMNGVPIKDSDRVLQFDGRDFNRLYQDDFDEDAPEDDTDYNAREDMPAEENEENNEESSGYRHFDDYDYGYEMHKYDGLKYENPLQYDDEENLGGYYEDLGEDRYLDVYRENNNY